jgi:hypothetical protein
VILDRKDDKATGLFSQEWFILHAGGRYVRFRLGSWKILLAVLLARTRVPLRAGGVFSLSARLSPFSGSVARAAAAAGPRWWRAGRGRRAW